MGNGLLEITPPLFKSGFSPGGGCTKLLQVEKVEGKGIFMDTPGLDDPKLRKQAAEAISAALKKEGFFRIFFVIFLQAGRVAPADKTTIQLVTEACQDVPDFCYSIIINKLPAKTLKKLENNTDGCMDDIMACLMENLPVKTVSVHYMESMTQLIDEDMDKNAKDADDRELKYKLPEDTFGFIREAPGVLIEDGKAKDVQADQFEKLKDEYGARIDELKGNLEEAKKVNEALKEDMKKAMEDMKKAQDKAAEERLQMIEEQRQRDKEFKEQLAKAEEKAACEARDLKNRLEQQLKDNQINKAEMEEKMKKQADDHDRVVNDIKTAHQHETKTKGPDFYDGIAEAAGGFVKPLMKGIRSIFGF